MTHTITILITMLVLFAISIGSYVTAYKHKKRRMEIENMYRVWGSGKEQAQQLMRKVL